jgi:hypothetical protein
MIRYISSLILKKSIFIMLCSSAILLQGQTPSVEWSNSHPQTLSSQAVSLSDGNILYYSVSNATPYSSKLVKIDSEGNIIWQKTYGGSGSDRIYSLLEVEGGYIFTGTSTSTDGDLNGIPNGSSWIVKVNSAGDILWQKRYDGAPYFRGIQETKDGGFIATGRVTANNNYVRGFHGGSGGDAWVVKLNSQGDTLWTSKCLGGTGDDAGQDIKQDTINGGYILLATSKSTNHDLLVGGTRDSEGKYWLVKLNENGNIEWQKRYGGSNIYESTKTILITKEGDYLAAGYTVSIDGDVSQPKGGNNYDIWLLWVDKDGNYIRDKSYGGTGEDALSYIDHTSDGGFVIASRSQSPDNDVKDFVAGTFLPWVLKINNIGEIQWSKYLYFSSTIINTGTGTSILELADGSYFVATQDIDAKLRPCPENISLTEKICAGTTYDFNGRILSIAGEYKDTLTTVGGCDSIITLTLEVAPLPTPAITAVQKKLSTTSFESYQWLLNNQPLASANSQTYTPDQSGTYRVITTNENNCSDTSAAFEFNIAGDPFLLRDKYTWKFSIPGMGEQVSDHIFYEDSILYQMAGTAYTTDYKMNKEYFDATEQRWIGVGEGGSIDKTGIYFVMFFKEDRGDSILIYKHECADQAEAYAFPFPAPDATTDHGWNWYVKAGTATSIAAAQELNATIYPNPVADELNISLSNNNAVEVSITTLDGREVLSESFAGRTTIQAGALPQGIYVVRISENGVLKTVQKIVKQ